MWGLANGFDNKVAAWLSKIAWTLPSLFCLSGYLMFKGFSYETCKGKLWNRVKRLAAPLYLINWAIVAFVAIGQLLGHNFGDKYDSCWYFKRTLCIAKGTGFTPLWYIRTLLIFMLASPIVYFFLRRSWGQLVLICGSIVWCLLSTCLGLDEELAMIIPSYAIAVYIFGGILAVRGREICEFARRYWFVWVVLYLIGLVTPNFFDQCQFNGIVGALQCMFWFSMAGWFERFLKFSIFKFLCSCAFFIYIIHVDMQWHGLGRMLGVAFRSFPPSLLGLQGAFLASLTLFFAFNIVSCSAVWLLLNRTCPLLARTLNGRL